MLLTDSNTWSYRIYCEGTGDLERVTCITGHLLGLNSMSHFKDQSPNLPRSSWSCLASSRLETAR